MADALYQLNPVSRMQNHIAVEALRAMVGRHAARQRRPMRILELGAGTGGTSAALLKVLPATGVVYHFTDVSHFFTDRAKARFAGLPFIEYGLFDINKGFAEQGYEPASFDLILAANAIHAAKHIDETLHQLREAPGAGRCADAHRGHRQHADPDADTGAHRELRPLPGPAQGAQSAFHVGRRMARLLAGAGFEGLARCPAWATLRRRGHSISCWLAARSRAAPWLPSVVTQKAVASRHAAAPAPRRRQPRCTNAPGDCGVGTADALSRLLGKLIHVDAARLDPQATFMELGVDSIVLMEFTHAVSRQHGVKLTVPQIFEHYPSLDKLSRFLDAGEAPASSVDAAEEV